jgi:hypothetical protein
MHSQSKSGKRRSDYPCLFLEKCIQMIKPFGMCIVLGLCVLIANAAAQVNLHFVDQIFVHDVYRIFSMYNTIVEDIILSRTGICN